MTTTEINLANQARIATDVRTEGGQQRHFQRIIREGLAGPDAASLRAKFLASSGSAAMNVDGSVTPVNFDFVAGASDRLMVYRLQLVMKDASIAVDKFGGLAALANGCLLKIHKGDNSTLLDLLDGQAAKMLGDLVQLPGATLDIRTGTADFAFVSLDLVAAFGGPVEVAAGDYIRLIVRDNLSALDQFRGMVCAQAF